MKALMQRCCPCSPLPPRLPLTPAHGWCGLDQPHELERPSTQVLPQATSGSPILHAHWWPLKNTLQITLHRFILSPHSVWVNDHVPMRPLSTMARSWSGGQGNGLLFQEPESKVTVPPETLNTV